MNRVFKLYCVIHKEFVGTSLPEKQEVPEAEVNDPGLDVNCMFRYKEVEKDE